DTLVVLPGRRQWTLNVPARRWDPSDTGMPEGRVDTVSRGAGAAAPLWAFAADQLYRSDDRGRRWRPVGGALPERNTAVRGIAVGPGSIVLTTDRGLLRSTNDGHTWELQEGGLPVHLEAGPRLRRPAGPHTLHA